ncbi:MAG TPA: ATP-binding protein [Methylomirabilota bacterium]|nr:ATP-binding protein [Methylomirabilota bacterium]
MKVLLVEDNPGDARLVHEMLSEETSVRCEVSRIERLAEALRRLEHEEFHVVLLDLSLPDSHGVSGVAVVQAKAPHVPIVVLTGLDDEAIGVEAVQAGAQDYLVKGQADGHALMRAIRYAVERKRILQELKAAQEQLVRGESLRMVGTLASGASHHLNNLMSIILGRIHLLLAKIEEPEVRRSITIVKQAALDSAQVVHRMQGLAQHQPIAESVRIDLNQLIEEMLEAIGPLSQSRSKRGVIDMSLTAGRIQTIAGDPASLREVVMNLLLNAIEALPNGGRITVKTWASGDSVYCSVADTGVGMPEDIRRRAFELFFTTKGSKSTGLGLSMAYGVVQQHGGEISIESEEGKGTTVTFRLPVPEGAELQAAGLPADRAHQLGGVKL